MMTETMRQNFKDAGNALAFIAIELNTPQKSVAHYEANAIREQLDYLYELIASGRID